MNNKQSEILGVLAVHREECVRCTHLVPWGDKTLDCTAPENPDCPAQCVKIALGFNLEHVAEKIADAWLSGDADRIEKQIKKLVRFDPHVKERTLHRARQLMLDQSKPKKAEDEDGD